MQTRHNSDCGYEYIAASLKCKKNETSTEKYVFNEGALYL